MKSSIKPNMEDLRRYNELYDFVNFNEKDIEGSIYRLLRYLDLWRDQYKSQK